MDEHVRVILPCVSVAIMEVDRDIFRKHLITHHSITSKQIMEADQFFKALCDPTRLRMLVLLSREGELCVCELTHALDEIQPKISRHLAQLREITAVLDRRQGQWIYYRLNPDLPDWARSVLSATAEGVFAQSPYKEDRQTLLDMPNRPGNAFCA